MQKQTNKPDIEEIYDKYSKRLYFTSYRIVGNTLDAEEIMQDTLIKYYNYKDKTIINNLEHWLVSICIRQSIDLLRKKKREKFFIDEYSDNNNAIETETETDSSNLHIQYNINDIKHNIELLPDILRIIISLHLLEGYDYQEISQITGLNENTIRSRYLRGKNKLVEMIKKFKKMDELEKIIKENRTLFNEGLMPDGHKERFLKKIAPKQKIKYVLFLF
jgi:RNA polymerase sigma factor, sigma-70 family